MKDSSLPWYCETNRDHRHQSQWESENCTKLYDLWQTTLADLNNRVRSDEVEHAVNLALLESDIDNLED
jgi:hypothetical protein